MHVVVDARSVLQQPTLRGTGRTLIALYNAMAAARPAWTFNMVYQEVRGSSRFGAPSNVTIHRIDGPGDRLNAWQHVWLPLHCVRTRADVFHAHSAVSPLVSPVPHLTTIHDLTPLEFRADEKNVQEWGRAVARSARSAKFVLTPSEYVREEVHRLLQIPRSKIRAVHHGYDPGPAPREDDDTVLRAYRGTDRPFLMHFGMSLARKNTTRVLEAWAALPHDSRSRASLLIVGLEGASLDHFTRMAASLGVGDSCHCIGYVPQEHVAALLGAASALLYVSLGEGFGLPILDAFDRGAPVIASNTTCMPEIAGDAALFVDPTDTLSIRDAMDRILGNPSLGEDLRCRGRERLTCYSWARCAGEVSELLEACAA